MLCPKPRRYADASRSFPSHQTLCVHGKVAPMDREPRYAPRRAPPKVNPTDSQTVSPLFDFVKWKALVPFTPFHFGPSAVIGIPLSRYLDPFTFVLASVTIDLEPLSVMVLHLHYPLHGYAHTFLGAALVGAIWGLSVWLCRNTLQQALPKGFKISFIPSRRKMVLSGTLGTWFHVLLDAPLYADIRPFYPFYQNPLYGLVGHGAMYLCCTLCFVPAAGLCLFYCLKADTRTKTVER
jgi:membrane-bound metal-dependent hydrolase YbcI (DUF457 family)